MGGRAGAMDEGRAAYARRAWQEAYDLLSAADRATPLDPADLERLAVAAYLIGRGADSERLWERAHQGFVTAGAPADAVRCAFWLGLSLVFGGEPARGGGWLARAGRLLAETGPDCVEWGYLRLPPGLQALDSGDLAAARAAFVEAAAVADRFRDPDLAALSRLGQGQVLIAGGEVAAGVSLLDEAMVAVTAGEVSPIPAGVIYCAVILACREVFDPHRAQEWTAALSRWCAEQPDLKPYRGQCLVHRSEILQLRGEWAGAMTEVRQACTHLADPPGDPVLGMALYQRAELHRLRGEPAAAEQAYRQAGDCGHPVQPGMALLRLAQGRTAEAAAAVRTALDEADSPSVRCRVLAAYVEIMLAGGETEAARAAADELAESARGFGSTHLRAMAEYAQGSMLLAAGDPTAALGRLRRAWRHWCDLPAPYEAAWARLLIGQACDRLGDADSAHREWDGARQVFERLGAVSGLARLAALSGARPFPGGLTAREVEVLALVAAGRSNREIAAKLVVSEHTVRRHLQNIFAKLEVGNRAAATAYAYEHGLA